MTDHDAEGTAADGSLCEGCGEEQVYDGVCLCCGLEAEAAPGRDER